MSKNVFSVLMALFVVFSTFSASVAVADDCDKSVTVTVKSETTTTATPAAAPTLVERVELSKEAVEKASLAKMVADLRCQVSKLRARSGVPRGLLDRLTVLEKRISALEQGQKEFENELLRTIRVQLTSLNERMDALEQAVARNTAAIDKLYDECLNLFAAYELRFQDLEAKNKEQDGRLDKLEKDVEDLKAQRIRGYVGAMLGFNRLGIYPAALVGLNFIVAEDKFHITAGGIFGGNPELKVAHFGAFADFLAVFGSTGSGAWDFGGTVIFISNLISGVTYLLSYEIEFGLVGGYTFGEDRMWRLGGRCALGPGVVESGDVSLAFQCGVEFGVLFP